MRIAIARNQVPFIAGGAETHSSTLCAALRARGHEADVITLPFRFSPDEAVAAAMTGWEQQDFTVLNGYTPDLVVCTQFPTYAVAHPRRVTWLCHQHRAVYELWDTPYVGDWPSTPSAQRLRAQIREFDRKHLAGCAARYTISRRVTERMQRYNGLGSTPLHPPVEGAEEIWSGEPLPYVFFPSRFEKLKRQDLVVRAIARSRSGVALVLAGDGGQLPAVRALAAELGVDDRVRFLGRISRKELLAFYANALAVCFPPFDEDYGYVTLEAMLAGRPVVTCADSGGPLEFVEDGRTGFVCRPDPDALAQAFDRLAGDASLARRLGREGRQVMAARDLSWDRVVATLTAKP